MEENLEAITVIDRLGGTSEVARMCDIKPPSVSDWKKYGIPKPWRKFLLCQHPEAFKTVWKCDNKIPQDKATA